MPIHINDYVVKLLSDKHFCDVEYRNYVNNCYILSDITGSIDPSRLNAVIRKAKWSRKMRSLLSGILLYVDHRSITSENFRLLLSFRGKTRNTFLSNIGHADLAFYQMQIISRSPVAFEAFAWLFDCVCQYSFFKDEDMTELLRSNDGITHFGIQSCIDSALEKYGPSTKLDAAIFWVGNTKKKDKS